MNVRRLKKIILEEVQKLMNEVATTSVPKNFDEYRTLIGNAAKQAGAPRDLVEEILDLGYEGGGVVGSLWDSWTSLEQSFRRVKDPVDQYDLMLDTVHDAVIDAAHEYFNTMNYHPGFKPQRFDASDLARRVENVLVGGKNKGSLSREKGDVIADDIIKPLVQKIKSKFSNSRVITRLGGTRSKTKLHGSTPHFDVYAPQVLPQNLVSLTKETLESLGCTVTGIEPDLYGDGTLTVEAETNDAMNRVMKRVSVDFELLSAGKIRVYVGVIE